MAHPHDHQDQTIRDPLPHARGTARTRRLRWVFLALLIPVAVGVAIRLTGVRHGAPDMVYHPDVAKQTLIARAVYVGDPDPRGPFRDDIRRTLYPYGTAVILGHAARLYSGVTGHDRLNEIHRWNWALWMRWVSVAMFGLASAVLLTMLHSQFGLSTALGAGCLILFEPMCAQLSHYGMNDVPLLAMLLLAWGCSGWIERDTARFPIYSLLTGLCLGIGFGVKYQALLGGLFPAAALLALFRKRGWAWTGIVAASVTAGLVLGMLLTCPLLHIAPRYFMDTLPDFMQWQAHIMHPPIPMNEKLPRNLAALAALFAARGGWLLTVGALAGLLLAARQRTDAALRAQAGSAAAFCVVLCVAIVVSRDIVRPNDFFPVSAFMALLAGLAFASPARPPRFARSLRAAPVCAVAVLVPVYLFTSVSDARALARTDTRILARDWCEAHLRPDTTVVRERYTLGPRRADLHHVRCRFLGESEPRAIVDAGRFDYIITSSLAHARFGDPTSPYHDADTAAFYTNLPSACTTRATFADRDLLYAHPCITVYEKQGAE